MTKIEPVNEEGEGFGCACPSHDKFDCIRLRLNPLHQPSDIDWDDGCECLCHDWKDADDQD